MSDYPAAMWLLSVCSCENGCYDDNERMFVSVSFFATAWKYYKDVNCTDTDKGVVQVLFWEEIEKADLKKKKILHIHARD